MLLDLHSQLTRSVNKHMWSNGNERKLKKTELSIHFGVEDLIYFPSVESNPGLQIDIYSGPG